MISLIGPVNLHSFAPVGLFQLQYPTITNSMAIDDVNARGLASTDQTSQEMALAGD
jgi:hypothetical protein